MANQYDVRTFIDDKNGWAGSVGRITSHRAAMREVARLQERAYVVNPIEVRLNGELIETYPANPGY